MKRDLPTAHFLNRELGILAFNRRVLAQAADESVPLLERLRFLTIVSSNLDEFFEIRVAGLKEQIELNLPEPGPDGKGPVEVPVLRGVSMNVRRGEFLAIVGQSGSGKSTLAYVIAGRPGYTITQGSITYDGRDLFALAPEERAAEGVFLAFQYPVEIPGVTLGDLLSEMAAAGGGEVAARAAVALEQLDTAGFVDRAVNVGLSGGEKKRSEMTQLLALAPRMSILDELDSGLDVDAVRDVATAVEAMRHPGMGILVITHYTRVLRYLQVDRVHVMLDGHIGRALLLVFWGVVLIVPIEGFLYPILVGHRLKLHNALVFIAVLGGLVAFGAVGLFIGPAILALTLGLVSLWKARMPTAHE